MCIYLFRSLQEKVFGRLWQLLGLDGRFLKETFGGHMFVEVALDVNNNIYLVTYAIVDIERECYYMEIVCSTFRLRIENCE